MNSSFYKRPGQNGLKGHITIGDKERCICIQYYLLYVIIIKIVVLLFKYLRYQVWIAEKLNKEMREENKRNDKVNTYFTLISDASGLSYKQMAYKPGKLTKHLLKQVFASILLNNFLQLWIPDWSKLDATKQTTQVTLYYHS